MMPKSHVCFLLLIRRSRKEEEAQHVTADGRMEKRFLGNPSNCKFLFTKDEHEENSVFSLFNGYLWLDVLNFEKEID